MGGYDGAIQIFRRDVTRKSRPIFIVLSGEHKIIGLSYRKANFNYML